MSEAPDPQFERVIEAWRRLLQAARAVNLEAERNTNDDQESNT